VNYAEHAEKAQDVVTGIQSKGGKAVAMQADMRQVAQARRLVLDTFRQFSRLEILVNTASKFKPKFAVGIDQVQFRPN